MNKPPVTKISEQDFEVLLDNLEEIIVRRSKPGASTMSHSLHEARRALINAARIGVDSSPSVLDYFASGLRRAMITQLASDEMDNPWAIDVTAFVKKTAHATFANFAIVQSDVEIIAKKTRERVPNIPFEVKGVTHFDGTDHGRQQAAELKGVLEDCTIDYVTR